MASFSMETIVCVLVILCSVMPSLATVHTVGDSNGWGLGSDYSTWANGKTFSVGDQLVFNYPSGHSVDEVSSSDYSTCSAGNSITSDSSGATTITLKTPGTHYFICSMMGHCSSGMKLAVTVAGGGGTTSGTPATTTPSSSGTNTITPPTVENPLYKVDSSSGCLSPLLAVVFASLAWFLAVLS